jgi:Xaa-Pro dipeptidase
MRDNPALHFDLDEYRRRLDRIWHAMEQRKLDVLLLSDPCNLYYATGYDAWSFYVPQAVLLPLGSERLIWVGREMDARGAQLTTYLEPTDIEPYSDAYVQAANVHPMSRVASVIRSRGWSNARIGVELGSYYFGARAWEVLRAELPTAVWQDASLLVNWVRVVKSEAELRYMRDAARIVERAMSVGLERIRPGVRQCDAAADIYHALISGTREFGGQYASSPPLMPSAERVDTPHLSWTSDPYSANSLTNLELVAVRHRYHTPLARSIFLGRPSAQARVLEAALVEGIDAVLTTLRPGMTAADVEGLWQGSAARHGVHKRARCGYSIGIAYPPTFGEQTISLRPGDETVLKENMTLHLMPGIWHDGASLLITEPLVVTARGCEPLCLFERRLFTVE